MRGFSCTFGYDPMPGSASGLTLSMGLIMDGASDCGVDALLGRTTLDGLAASDNGDDLVNRRFEMPLGYCLPVQGDRFIVTSGAGFGNSSPNHDYGRWAGVWRGKTAMASSARWNRRWMPAAMRTAMRGRSIPWAQADHGLVSAMRAASVPHGRRWATALSPARSRAPGLARGDRTARRPEPAHPRRVPGGTRGWRGTQECAVPPPPPRYNIPLTPGDRSGILAASQIVAGGLRISIPVQRGLRFARKHWRVDVQGSAGMFAVVRSGGKQYRVGVGDVLTLERLDVEAGESVELSEVLLLCDGETAVGTPLVEGAHVRACVIDHIRGPKLLSFKRRRRKASSKRLKGHRQELTRLKILEISHGDPGSDAQERDSGQATGEG